jgi:hypothetical protein
MKTEIDPALLQDASLKSHVQNAARFLEARVGSTALEPRAVWTLVKNSDDSSEIQVRVSDEGMSEEAAFTPHEIADYQFTKMRLYDLWFDLLGKRIALHNERYQELVNSSAEE